MTIQEHLEDRLQNPQSFALSEEEQKRVQFEGMAAQIYARSTSAKWRKSALDADAQV